jgi:hypothetical protein
LPRSKDGSGVSWLESEGQVVAKQQVEKFSLLEKLVTGNASKIVISKVKKTFFAKKQYSGRK